MNQSLSSLANTVTTSSNSNACNTTAINDQMTAQAAQLTGYFIFKANLKKVSASS